MSSFINYLIEANIGLCLFMLLYVIALRKETNFGLKRILLLSGIMASLLFPVIHLNITNSPVPSLTELVPSYLLPEISINGNGHKTITSAQQSFWNSITAIYLGGVLFFTLLFAARLFKLIRLITSSTTYTINNFIVAESANSKLTFSFFRFIFIGQANSISAEEKQQMLNHERIHAQQWHSFDIMLLHSIGILFWFNPLLHVYKKIFVQLHEFEADARAVESHEVNEYCSLLARVALQSADFTIASHFNQSLTLKRIAMMQTMKTKIKTWKIAAVIAVFPAFFILVACQDQLTDDLKTVANASAVSLDIPADIQAKIKQLKADHPEKEFGVIETTTKEGKMTADKMDVSKIASLNVIKSKDRSFIIIERSQQNIAFAQNASTDKVYTLVEHQPEYVGGNEAMRKHIMDHMEYPEAAKNAKIEGTTFTSFVVNTDGTMSDIQIVKGLSPECDKEAVRVIQLMPKWIPGKQDGKNVSVRFVLPIKFALS